MNLGSRTLSVLVAAASLAALAAAPAAAETATFADPADASASLTDIRQVTVRHGVETLRPYICPTFMGFPGTMQDVYRAREFLREFAEFEAKGELPNLIMMLLPNDHTEGTSPGFPTPRARVADNDLALGRIVEAVSRSRFWPETAIFVAEDDPQNGFDHVDGPDHTPDGEWVWFNGEREGRVDLWRVRPDGSGLERMTGGETVDWFPHPSPDGRHVLFLAYPPETKGHPALLDVALRIMPAEGGESRAVLRLLGGQGTINVPCWAPDGRRFAFVRFEG